MISPHIKDRFFQRYGIELTVEVLRELVTVAIRVNGVADSVPGRERVTVLWRGQQVRLVWSRDKRYIFTFLPPLDPADRIALCLPKRKRRR